MKESEYIKTVKCPLDDILLKNRNYDLFYDAIYRADELVKLVSLFINAHHRFLYSSKKELPIIDEIYIRMTIRALSKSSSAGRPPNSDNKIIFDNIEKFYDEEFKVKLNITEKFDSSNLSYILAQISSEIVMSIKNNIKYHFEQHLKRFVLSNFKDEFDKNDDKLKGDSIIMRELHSVLTFKSEKNVGGMYKS
jgi:hypothetical protein